VGFFVWSLSCFAQECRYLLVIHKLMGKISVVKAKAPKNAIKPSLSQDGAPSGVPVWDDLPEKDRLFLLQSLQDVKEGRIVSWDEAERRLNAVLDK
jgi:hypothetical protein